MRVHDLHSKRVIKEHHLKKKKNSLNEEEKGGGTGRERKVKR